MKQAAFTMIELLIVVSILMMIALAGVASYNQMTDRAKVDEAAKAIASELRSIQKDTDAGKNECTAGQAFSGNRVSASDNSNKPIQVQNICNGGVAGSPKFVPENGLPSGITVVLSGIEPYDFLTLNQGVNNTFKITVTGSISKTITVTAAGGISVN